MPPFVHQVLEWDTFLLDKSQALRWQPLTALFVLASAWWVKWPLFVAVGGLVDRGRRVVIPTAAVSAAGAAAAAASLVAVVKDGVDRVRPALADSEITALVATPESPSFPSGHSATAFAAATAVAFFCPRLRVPLLALAGLVAASRVYLGVHYVLDVIVGATLGVAIGLAIAAVVRAIAQPGTRAAQNEPRFPQ